jgi:hypothetical protein
MHSQGFTLGYFRSLPPGGMEAPCNDDEKQKQVLRLATVAQDDKRGDAGPSTPHRCARSLRMTSVEKQVLRLPIAALRVAQDDKLVEYCGLPGPRIRISTPRTKTCPFTPASKNRLLGTPNPWEPRTWGTQILVYGPDAVSYTHAKPSTGFNPSLSHRGR